MYNYLKNRLKKFFLYNKSYRISFRPNFKKKLVNIIVFNGSINHGGFVDRLKGMITTYQASKLFSKGKFKIYHHTPFDLSVYLIPNMIDWSCNKNQLNMHYPESKLLYSMDHFNYQLFLDDFKRLNNRYSGQNHIYTNLDYTTYLNDYQCDEIWKKSFFELFKKTEFLKNLLSKYDTSNCVGIHIRFGSILGDFIDTVDLGTLNQQDKEVLIKKIKKIVYEIKLMHPKHTIYLFSDSYNFNKDCKDTYNDIIITKGVPIHTDSGKTKLSHDKTLIDFFLLSKCKFIYQLKSKEIFSSQFSKYAALIGSSKFETIHLQH